MQSQWNREYKIDVATGSVTCENAEYASDELDGIIQLTNARKAMFLALWDALGDRQAALLMAKDSQPSSFDAIEPGTAVSVTRSTLLQKAHRMASGLPAEVRAQPRQNLWGVDYVAFPGLSGAFVVAPMASNGFKPAVRQLPAAPQGRGWGFNDARQLTVGDEVVGLLQRIQGVRAPIDTDLRDDILDAWTSGVAPAKSPSDSLTLSLAAIQTWIPERDRYIAEAHPNFRRTSWGSRTLVHWPPDYLPGSPQQRVNIHDQRTQRLVERTQVLPSLR